MAKNRERQRANKKKAMEEKRKQEGPIGPRTEGHADYTPYNAITGKDVMSKPTLTDLSKKVDGSFNG